MYTAVQAGFAVLAPNPTGSLGFGQELTNGIWGNTWGDQCYKDIMAATDAFCEHPGVDKSRISVMGASFGGYMTNWIGTQTSRFRALVTHAGLFDLISFQPVTDYPTWWILQMGGIDPYLDPIEYSKHSPRQHIHQTRTPTLITHGDKDYRVPVDQSLALFEALQHHKVPAELIIFPEENHFIERPTNAVAWYEAIFDFLHRNTR
jgi:dipeptidyl aminopeptidase/acylaminoacyl peptidase